MNEVAQQITQQVPDTFNGMFIGYSVFWIGIALYVVFLGIKLKHLEKRK